MVPPCYVEFGNELNYSTKGRFDLFACSVLMLFFWRTTSGRVIVSGPYPNTMMRFTTSMSDSINTIRTNQCDLRFFQSNLPDMVTLIAWTLEGLLHHAPIPRVFAAQAPDGDAADAWVGI